MKRSKILLVLGIAVLGIGSTFAANKLLNKAPITVYYKLLPSPGTCTGPITCETSPTSAFCVTPPVTTPATTVVYFSDAACTAQITTPLYRPN